MKWKRPPLRLGALRGSVDAGDELDAGEQVHEQISAESLAVVGEAAPAEEADGIEGELGRVAEEGIPVDGLFTGVGRNGIDPGAAGRVAIPVSVDGEDFAQFAGIVNLFRFRVEHGTHALAADSDHAFMFLRGFDHGESVFDEMRHRLLAVDVFAGSAGVFEDVAVLVIHSGDEDGVDVFAVENGAVVAGSRDAGIFHRFLRGGVTAVVEVADGDALYAGNVKRGLEMFASANAGADGGEANGVAGRDRACGGGEHVRLQYVLGDGGGGDSAATDLNELTTRQGIFSH